MAIAQTQCPDCGARVNFRVNMSSLEYYEDDAEQPTTSNAQEVTCPRCKSSFVIAENDLDARVRETLANASAVDEADLHDDALFEEALADDPDAVDKAIANMTGALAGIEEMIDQIDYSSLDMTADELVEKFAVKADDTDILQTLKDKAVAAAGRKTSERFGDAAGERVEQILDDLAEAHSDQVRADPRVARLTNWF